MVGGVRTSSRGWPTQDGDTGYVRRVFTPVIKEPTGLFRVFFAIFDVLYFYFSLSRFHFPLVLRESTLENNK